MNNTKENLPLPPLPPPQTALYETLLITLLSTDTHSSTVNTTLTLHSQTRLSVLDILVKNKTTQMRLVPIFSPKPTRHGGAATKSLTARRLPRDRVSYSARRVNLPGGGFFDETATGTPGRGRYAANFITGDHASLCNLVSGPLGYSSSTDTK